MPIVDAYLEDDFDAWDLTKEDVMNYDLVGSKLPAGDSEVTVADEDTIHYKYGWADESPINEYGVCDCGLEVMSWSKHAICPECGEQVYLT